MKGKNRPGQKRCMWQERGMGSPGMQGGVYKAS
jgi:hypothetical protein